MTTFGVSHATPGAGLRPAGRDRCATADAHLSAAVRVVSDGDPDRPTPAWSARAVHTPARLRTRRLAHPGAGGVRAAARRGVSRVVHRGRDVCGAIDSRARIAHRPARGA